ncbi:MAG TPA: class I SAM-dependent methyltransferase [Cyclobacteriaceae bacterium]|nr:class I SAM-dependent methyltransferase [Cyclobacteriaceae bacterium]
MGWWNRIKVLPVLDAYNLWAQTYHTESNPIKKMSDEFVASQLPALKNKSVLDAGCGTGKFCVIASEQNASFVKGIDLSPVMIEEAKKNCPTATLECADLATATIEPSRYDVIICGLVLGHIGETEPVLQKLAAALKTGGRIILTDFHPYQSMMKAKRTFKDTRSGKTFEVKHNIHKLDEYFTILRNAGIELKVFNEPLFEGKPVIFGISGVRS